jgi:hypothetical protein
MLDFDELDGLSKALAFMIDKSKAWAGSPLEAYTEVGFSSKGDVKIGFYQKGTEQRIFVTVGSVGAAQAYLPIGQLAALKAAVDKAAAFLPSK